MAEGPATPAHYYQLCDFAHGLILSLAPTFHLATAHFWQPLVIWGASDLSQGCRNYGSKLWQRNLTHFNALIADGHVLQHDVAP